MRYLWRVFLAFFRLDLDLVCELSRGKGLYDDYHGYPDSDFGYPMLLQPHRCVRCGKHFYL
jgi:hypothetical protein